MLQIKKLSKVASPNAKPEKRSDTEIRPSCTFMKPDIKIIPVFSLDFTKNVFKTVVEYYWHYI